MLTKTTPLVRAFVRVQALIRRESQRPGTSAPGSMRRRAQDVRRHLYERMGPGERRLADLMDEAARLREDEKAALALRPKLQLPEGFGR